MTQLTKIAKFYRRSFGWGHNSLRSSLLEVVGARRDGRARGRHVCLPRERLFFLAPTSSKRVLCRLGAHTYSQQTFEIFVTSPRYEFARLRRIPFKFGNFIDYKTLFPTLPGGFSLSSPYQYKKNCEGSILRLVIYLVSFMANNTKFIELIVFPAYAKICNKNVS